MIGLDRNDMLILERDECLRRLGRGGIGRIALAPDGEPAIFPVNYSVHEGDIYFRTTPGSKLAAAAEGALIAFEVDQIDRFEHAGWSVLIVGPSGILGPDEAEPMWKLKLGRWAGGGPEILVRIRADKVTGREIAKPGVNIPPPTQAVGRRARRA